MSRVVAGLALLLATLTVASAPAAADAAGPTDYRSEVSSVEPTVDVGIRFIGGDSFIELDARGHDVLITGYRGEPYVWFRTDGTVVENERSPTRSLNRDRYGQVDLPDAADVDAEPAWVRVADDGVYAWHDHRTHWMNPDPPPGAEPGDQVLEGVVPLVVDGVDVDVTVVSFLLDPPKALPSVAAGVAGIVVGGLAWLLVWRRGWVWSTVVVALGAATAALVAGTVAFRSVPAETGPPLTLWLLPLTAVAFVLGALAISWPRAMTPGPRAEVTRAAVLAAVGLQLVLCAWQRREALLRALIPSDFPPGLDRGLVAAVGGVGLALVAGAAWELSGRATPGPSTTGA